MLMMNEEELLRKLRDAFKSESEERLANLSAGLLELEKTSAPDQQHSVIETIFREAHSLKGAARAVNLAEIETLCQAVEGIFAELKRGEPLLSPGLFDSLHDAVEAIKNFLADQSPENKGKIADLVCEFEEVRTGSGVPQYPAAPRTQSPEPRTQSPDLAPPKKSPVSSETLKIPISKLDKLLLEAEELSSLKLAGSQNLLGLRNTVQSFETWKKQWSRAEPEYRLLRNLTASEISADGKNLSLSNLTAFLDWNQEYVRSLGHEIKLMKKSMEQDHRMLSRMTDDLSNDMKKIMMLPFSTLFDVFSKMVRDISRSQGKESELVLEGGETEIDRRILEEMKDPVMHLLRNAADHGLEEAEIRTKCRKPERGIIKLSVSRIEGGKVEILISDDGSGVDIARIKEEAVKAGMLSQGEAEILCDQDALSLILRSGISSSMIITELSGRGIGLAIVQEKVEKLGGLLSIETKAGKGTSFRIRLPLTLATFRGVLVKAADELFVVPASQVERVLKIHRDEVRTLENRTTVLFNGQVLPLAELADLLKLEESEKDNEEFLTLMVLVTGQKRAAFRVSEVLCEQEVLVKNLGLQLSRVANIAGATILGNGKAVPILNVHDLMKTQSAGRIRGIRESSPDDPQIFAKPKKPSVLIAEDSITSRTLIKNILQASGYEVKTAVDGQDAYTLLKSEAFDAVVSDVEMPRMNGFELTEKIRGNEKLADIPVILVTSLDSREDRERGIDAGADAYIVKSNFDQSNLLEVIGRLV